MLNNLDRSRAHAALHDLWADPTDARRAALAAILALYADHPELPAILILIDALEVPFCVPVDLDFDSIVATTGLDADAVELALAAAGAREVGPDWTTAHEGETAEPFTLTADDWRAYCASHLGLKTWRRIHEA